MSVQNVVLCVIGFFLDVTLRTVHLSGWKDISQSCSNLAASSRSCCKSVVSLSVLMFL